MKKYKNKIKYISQGSTFAGKMLYFGLSNAAKTFF